MSIRAKFTALAVVVALILAAVISTSLYTNRLLTGASESTYRDSAMSIEKIGVLQSLLDDIRIKETLATSYGAVGEVDRVGALAAEITAQHELLSAETASLAAEETARASLRDQADAYVAGAMQSVESSREYLVDDAIAAVTGTSRDRYIALKESLERLRRSKVEQARLRSEEAAAHARTSKNLMVALAVVAAGLVASLLAFRTSIVTPIDRMVSFVKKVAGGDLSAEVQIVSRDELGVMGRSLTDMSSNVSGLVGSVGASFRKVEEVTGQLGGMTDSLVTGAEREGKVAETLGLTTEQLSEVVEKVVQGIGTIRDSAQSNLSSIKELASSVSQMASSSADLAATSVDASSAIHEMSATISQTAASISSVSRRVEESSTAMSQVDGAVRKITDLTGSAREVARSLSRTASEKGKNAMERAKSRMDVINSLFDRLGESARNVEGRSREIEEIVTIITDIADQTNLLALNASILSAQAGEHGRGFAVVAEEVRQLAERSTESIKQIRSHVSTIQQQTSRVVADVEQGASAVQAGVEEVGGVAQVIEEIISGTVRTEQMAASIADETKAQAGGSSTVARSLQEIASAFQQINASAGQQEGTARQILRIAEDVGTRSERMKQTTSEQARTLQWLAQEIEKAAETTDKVAAVTRQADIEVGRIREAMNVINQVTYEGHSLISSLKGSVVLLTSQSEEVRQRLSTFVLTGSNGSSAGGGERGPSRTAVKFPGRSPGASVSPEAVIRS